MTSGQRDITAKTAPYFELRIGGFRVTAERIPVKALSALTGVATAALTWWAGH
jgi:hypothetical protein